MMIQIHRRKSVWLRCEVLGLAGFGRFSECVTGQSNGQGKGLVGRRGVWFPSYRGNFGKKHYFIVSWTF